MTSTIEIVTFGCPEVIGVENQNVFDNKEHEIPTYASRCDLTHSLEDSTSSIVSDSIEDSAIHYDRNNLPLQDLSRNSIHIKKSSDILIGSKTHFSGSVTIQNFIAGNEGQNHSTIEEPKHSSNCNWCCSLRTFIPCKSKWIYIILVPICLLSVLGGIAVAIYFLYLHYAVYSVAGALFVCKTIDSTACYIGSSTTSCSNIVSADGRPFISGHTTSGVCKIYSKKNCQGDVQNVETDHISFYFIALSARCK